MINTWLFDVDGVLCNTNEKIDPEFHDWFVDWSKDKEYYIVTGGERLSTVNQIGLEILNNAKIQFHCMGNRYLYQSQHFLQMTSYRRLPHLEHPSE